MFSPSLDLTQNLAFILSLAYSATLLIFLKREWGLARLIASSVFILISLRYFAWRATNFEGSYYSMWFFALELLATVENIIFTILLVKHRDNSTVADEQQKLLEASPPETWPSVDILIPTYNEGEEVLEATIATATHVDYPNKTVWVCDDGKDRDWLKSLAERHGANYINRSDRSHAKAGNINNALKFCKGDLFAVIDADFCLTPIFLRRVVGLFNDPTVGMVQIPHHFFNRDVLQVNSGMEDSIPDEQRLFFNHLAPARDAWEVAFCCGSLSIAKRQVVVESGGIPTESITEDILTSMVLLRKNWKTRFLNERLAVGLAAENLEGHIVQRKRWCRGALQTLFLPSGPLGPGLTLKQRVFFLPTSWIAPHPLRIFMLLVPGIYFLFDVAPYPALDLAAFADIVAPLIIITVSTMVWYFRECYIPFLSFTSQLQQGLHILPTAIATLFNPFEVEFKVTPKGKAAKKRSNDTRTMLFGIIVGVFTTAGMVTKGVFWPDYSSSAFNLVATLWGALTLLACGLLILLSIDRGGKEEQEVFNIEMTLVARSSADLNAVKLTAMSNAVAEIESVDGVSRTFDALQIDGIGWVPIKPVEGSTTRHAIERSELSTEQKDMLTCFLYSGKFETEIRETDWRALVKGVL